MGENKEVLCGSGVINQEWQAVKLAGGAGPPWP